MRRIGRLLEVTPNMALRLSRAFGTTPELWLNLRRDFDFWHASHDSKAWQRVRAIAPGGRAVAHAAAPLR